ncbi:MAG TPA: hypothetical protein VMC80_01145 [Patescibacteria group bacterium]|nr:hypothetical protein [Patescibacteria group bacterium]
MPYALYKTEYEGRRKKEILVDVVSKREMVKLLPIFNEANGNHLPKSERTIPSAFYMQVTASCAKRLLARKDIASCIE